MRNRKTTIGAMGTIGLFVLYAFFNENFASLFEATKLNLVWQWFGPLGRFLASGFHLLWHPVMTHLYALLAGVCICALVIRLAAKAIPKEVVDDESMPLGRLVNYLRNESAWAYDKGNISDQDLRFELIDALGHGLLTAFARPRKGHGYGVVLMGHDHLDDEHPSPLQRISPSYFDAAAINLDAVESGGPNQIGSKPGYYADEFDHWIFSSAEVRKIWPPYVEPKTKGKRGK